MLFPAWPGILPSSAHTSICVSKILLSTIIAKYSSAFVRNRLITTVGTFARLSLLSPIIRANQLYNQWLSKGIKMLISNGSIASLADWFNNNQTRYDIMILYVAGDLSDNEIISKFIDFKETIHAVTGKKIAFILSTP